MKQKTVQHFMCDFETTVYDGQEDTQVWASAIVPISTQGITDSTTQDVQIFHSIDALFDYVFELKQNSILYFHNLKFDGEFILYYLIHKEKFTHALEDVNGVKKWKKDRDMKSGEFKYMISDMGQWYDIVLKKGSQLIQIRDSLKLLPFSVKRIGLSFGTRHKKLDMEYDGFRYPGCEITDKEKEYIANDVLVVKEALEIMFNQGHNNLTIGSCCMQEFRRITGKADYNLFFPDLYGIELNETEHGEPNAGEWIRHSYRGGWCYLVKGKENKLYHNGTTADVNSLYPSVMSSESGSLYPCGKPKFWTGALPDEAIGENKYYFIRIRTRFRIKPLHLPFIQVKGSPLYRSTECLVTSDVYNKKDGCYYDEYIDIDGSTKPAIVELTLTMTDYQLIKEHYDLYDLEEIDGCWFWGQVGIFDMYIDKYKKIKLESKGAVRELAKLFLNNLYGKMATNTNSSFKLCYTREDGSLGFETQEEHDKKPGYIAVGSAITSYARNFTIRAAQKNYHGKTKPGFIYADTDSIHCDLPPDKIEGIKVHDKDFCCWKLEAQWDVAWFCRQKTYIEHVVAENLQPIEKPYYNIKCAGMPQRCKELFLKSMEGGHENDVGYDEYEQEFLQTKRQLEDFTIGLKVPGKLVPKHIRGGVLLCKTTYEMR